MLQWNFQNQENNVHWGDTKKSRMLLSRLSIIRITLLDKNMMKCPTVDINYQDTIANHGQDNYGENYDFAD